MCVDEGTDLQRCGEVHGAGPCLQRGGADEADPAILVVTFVAEEEVGHLHIAREGGEDGLFVWLLVCWLGCVYWNEEGGERTMVVYADHDNHFPPHTHRRQYHIIQSSYQPCESSRSQSPAVPAAPPPHLVGTRSGAARRPRPVRVWGVCVKERERESVSMCTCTCMCVCSTNVPGCRRARRCRPPAAPCAPPPGSAALSPLYTCI